MARTRGTRLLLPATENDQLRGSVRTQYPTGCGVQPCAFTGMRSCWTLHIYRDKAGFEYASGVSRLLERGDCIVVR